jgi:hypothetical protein
MLNLSGNADPEAMRIRNWDKGLSRLLSFFDLFSLSYYTFSEYVHNCVRRVKLVLFPLQQKVYYNAYYLSISQFLLFCTV